MTRLLVLLSALLVACGGDAQNTPPDDARAVPSVTTAEAPSAPSEPPAAAPDAFTMPDLTPTSLTFDEPLSVSTLREAIVAPYGKTVTVHGYVQDAPSSVTGKVQIGQTVALAAEPGQGDREAGLVTCRLDARPEQSRVDPEAVVVLRGRVKAPNSGKMRLEDGCEIVSVGEDPPQGAISARDLHGTMLGWVGTGVSVVGRYNGTTTSQLPSGPKTTVRLEAPGTEGLTGQVVTCVMAGPVPGIEERDGVVMNGIVTDNWRLASDRSVEKSVIELGDCTFVNR